MENTKNGRSLPWLYLNKYFQRLTGSLPFELPPSKWVFIIGCYNSGTTLLDAVLQSHPEISGLPYEGAFLSDSLPYPEQFGFARMWHLCRERMNVSTTRSEEDTAKRIRRQWLWCSSNHADIVVEKSISNATRVAFLNNNFKNAHFIYLVRNGYAVAEGIRRKANPARWGNDNFPHGYPIEMCARQWVESNMEIRASLPSANRHLILKYEDLAENTISTLDKITSFLDIGFFGNHVLSTVWKIKGVPSKITNMNGKNIAELTTQEKLTIYNTARHELDLYSYGPNTATL